jgi:hypothetical protein
MDETQRPTEATHAALTVSNVSLGTTLDSTRALVPSTGTTLSIVFAA